MKITAIVLAAGRGTRLGGPKAHRELGGRSFLARILGALEGRVDTTVVVAAADDVGFPEASAIQEARIVRHPDPDLGRTSSLQRGALAAPGDHALLVWPVDVPLVHAETLATLCSAPLAAAAFRVPTWEGRGGHPVLLAPELRAGLLALEPDRSLRALRDAPGTRLERVAVADRGVLLDIDTPDDLRRAQAWLAARAASRPGPDQR